MGDKLKALGEEPIGRLLFKFSIPSVAMMLVNTLYSVADRLFVGQALGTHGLNAVTAAFPPMIIAFAAGMLFSVGASSLGAIALGEGRRDEAKRLRGQALGLSAATGIALAALSFLLAEPALRLFGCPEADMAMARDFLRALSPGFAFLVPSMSAGALFRAEGRPNAAMVSYLSGVVINLALEPLFIFGLGWGAAGAGLATSIAQAGGFCITLALARSPESAVRLSASEFRPRPRGAGRLLGTGLPAAAVQAMSTVMLGVANNVIAGFGGDSALALIGVVNTVAMMLLFPAIGVAQAAQSIWGYNFGAGREERVRATSRLAAIWTTAIGAASTVVVVAFAPEIVSLFAPGDPAFIASAARACAIYLSSFCLFALSSLPAPYFQSLGRPVETGVLLAGKNILAIAFMLVMPSVAGLDGFLLSGPLSDIAVSAIAAALLLGPGRRVLREKAAASRAEAEAA